MKKIKRMICRIIGHRFFQLGGFRLCLRCDRFEANRSWKDGKGGWRLVFRDFFAPPDRGGY